MNRRQARWALYLSEFDVKLVHIPGHKMIQSDALSRRPDFIPDEDNDNEDITMLPNNLFVNLIDVELQQRIANCDAMDKDATDALTTLLNQRSNAIGDQLNEWTMEKFNGKHILFFKEKNYVAQNEELRRYPENVS